jgi:transposase
VFLETTHKEPAMKQISVNVPAQVIGLDLSDEKADYCLMDGHKKILRQGSVEMSPGPLKGFFGAIESSRVVLEASGQSTWVAKLIRSCGHEVIVIDPRRFEVLTKSTKKTDRNDARLLAEEGRVDVERLKPVHEKTNETLAIQVELRARTQLVRTRTRLINLVRSSIKLFGSKPPKCTPDAFYKRVELPAELGNGLKPVVRVLAKLQAEIEGCEKRLAKHCEKHCPQTELLREIHGVGPVVALSFVTAVEKPGRFKSSRAVGAYFGLTPKKDQSGESDPSLGISKEGDGVVRSLLVGAAAQILRSSAPDTDLKRFGRRLARSGTKRDKGRARIAVARKLAILMHRMWLTGEVYQPLRMQAT